MIVSGMQMEKDRAGNGFFWNKNLITLIDPRVHKMQLWDN